MLVVTALSCGAPGGTGPDGGGLPDPAALQLVTFTASESPVPVVKTAASMPVGLTVVMKLAKRDDGSTQHISLAKVSLGGKQLAELVTSADAPNIFRAQVDRGDLFDPTLATRGDEDPKVTLSLEFVDDRSDTRKFDVQLGVECATGPVTEHAYFCRGSCGGLHAFPTPDLDSAVSCGGCGLACTYAPPGGATTSGTCSSYSHLGSWVETCGVAIELPPTPTGAVDLSQSCTQVCAKYSGRGKPGTCFGHCAAGSAGLPVYFGDASGETYGSVEGIIAGKYTNTPNPNRGLVFGCDQSPAAYLASLPVEVRPAQVRAVSCCCAFD
ncbi:MAG: hypothetical protein IPJ65_30965 [Archangiaceae bacterium]|nr:hypothetical protein [Archangiaceae bacterium]